MTSSRESDKWHPYYGYEQPLVMCRGAFSLGTACGSCMKCKAQAFDWLVENLGELDYWAVMKTGRHDVMGAVRQEAKKVR